MLNLLAYFDPGSGSILMQALVGGTAGLMVFGKYLWNATLVRTRMNPPTLTSGDRTARSSNSSGEIPIPSWN